MLGLVLGTLRLPLIVLVTGSPLAAAGTNIAISAASAGAGGGRTPARVAWTGALSAGQRRTRLREPFSAPFWQTMSRKRSCTG